MPEGPEVQVVVDTLACALKDAKIIDVDLRYPKIVSESSIQPFTELLKGQHFRSFERIGKYLVLTLDDYRLICHLRMEGKFYIFNNEIQESKHIHVVFTLEDGRKLCYHDTRKFGRMGLYSKEESIRNLFPLKKLGLDFQEEACNGQYLYACIHPLKKNLKAALLDQSIIAGIGNIYANEICFEAHLDPRIRCSKLSKKDCALIVEKMKLILNKAIQCGGTTIRDYTSSLGVSGRFQIQLKVHGKKGEPCPNCGQAIDKIVVGQRGTYLCRKCQKRK